MPMRTANRSSPAGWEEQRVAAGEVILNTAGIPTFAYPDTATRIFTLMWRYAYNLRGIYETPVLADGPARGE